MAVQGDEGSQGLTRFQVPAHFLDRRLGQDDPKEEPGAVLPVPGPALKELQGFGTFWQETFQTVLGGNTEVRSEHTAQRIIVLETK
ncbi:MAG: hypothetical protein L0Z62_10880 [Gemmataceae bacterium]|nr:hypothetical protein [Gemmataceae bacterium]